ncbi:hypothetical protein BD770DRAFT_440466 [Pilaira anomala]|nr:hypothetical protein BD770DRAFT_440466 [Pilaira anomala]
MNLPEEILLIIFQDQSILSTIDIFQCQLVCKQWKTAAQRTNYTYLTLQEHHHIPKLIQTFQQTPIQYSPGKFVKKITLTQPSQQQFLIELLDIFPFIDTIQVPEPDVKFYSNLISTVQHRPHVQYLKHFPAPLLQLRNTKLLELYTNCALKYCDTLQYLLFYDNNHNTFKLHQFPNLQQLIIKQHTNNNINSLDNIIDQYPKLKKLDVALYRPESSSSTNTTTTTTTIMTDYYSKIIPRPTIKSLDGLFVVRDDTLRYIMYKFPQLQELSINHSWREDTEKLSHVNMDISLSTLSQFIPYILSIPCCALSLNLETLFITHALETYIKHMPTTQLGPLYITYTHADSDPSTRWTAHRTTNKNQSHEFYIDYRCQTNALLHLNLLESIGDRLTEITYRTNIDSLRHVHGYFLDHLLQHCPNLKKIRLSSTKLIRCLREPTMHTLTHLVLLNCYLGKNVFSQLSERFKKLNKLILIRCRFGNSGIDTEYIHINMSQTVLNAIRIKTEHSLITFITVRVTREGQDMFYRLWLDKVSQGYKTECSSLQEYDLMIKTEQHMKIWIECKQINSIQIFTNSRGNHVVYGEVLVL